MSDIGPMTERIPDDLPQDVVDQLAQWRAANEAAQALEDEAAAFLLGPRKAWPAVLERLPSLRGDQFPPGIWLSPGSVEALRSLCLADGRADLSLAFRAMRETLSAGARIVHGLRSLGLCPRVHLSVSQGWHAVDFDVIDRRLSTHVQIGSPIIELAGWGDDLEVLWSKAILSTDNLVDEARRLLPFQLGPQENAGKRRRK